MKIFFTFLFSCLFILPGKAQNFNGQWKGSFVDNSVSFMGIASEKIDYVLELECSGTDVSGYSYTYFTEGGKRYYTICKLHGTINRATKEIVVTEFERAKYNTPPDFSNCFQTHRLKYLKQNSDTETLQGSWVPAPNQSGNCGYGRTILTRAVVKRNPVVTKNISPALSPKKNQPFRDMNRQRQKPVAHHTRPANKPQPKINKTPQPPLVKNNSTIKKQTPAIEKKDTVVHQPVTVNKPAPKKEEKAVASDIKFEKRINSILKTIPIKNETFTVDFYDNGEIDGDSISVFFNGKLMLSHKRLSDKPISLTLTVDPNREVNELVMYAENLGTIPPNTALMIVHDGDNRYESRIESDLGRNGTIRFSYKPNH